MCTNICGIWVGFYLKLAFSCFNPMVLFVPWTSMAELVLCPWTGGISTSILIIDQCLITPPSYETLSKKHWEYKYYMSESDTQRSRGGIPWLMTDRCRGSTHTDLPEHVRLRFQYRVSLIRNFNAVLSTFNGELSSYRLQRQCSVSNPCHLHKISPIFRQSGSLGLLN